MFVLVAGEMDERCLDIETIYAMFMSNNTGVNSVYVHTVPTIQFTVLNATSKCSLSVPMNCLYVLEQVEYRSDCNAT